MKKNNEWAITFDVWNKGEGDESTEIYDNIEQKLGIFLQEKFGNCEFVVDTPDGAEYAVTFKVFSDESPDQKDLALIPIFIGNGIWEIDGIDIREFKDLSDRYGQNRNPFEDLTFKLLDEAIRCYTERLYDGVDILCRSAIDSSVYLACVWARNKVNKDKYQFRLPKPFEAGEEVS